MEIKIEFIKHTLNQYYNIDNIIEVHTQAKQVGGEMRKTLTNLTDMCNR